ncbi:MAG: hypothetical protein EA412_14420 [Chitinophagaceae bacterium]|jgi:hypothetical protein|nr:MAG: hypothetical protein EA412_14420 [Chitinophagaceae bacterium]
MKLAVIKKLVNLYELDELKAAEESILNEDTPEIEVDGKDEGEQLTHVSAAIWIIEKMESDDLELSKAIRAYSQRVRDSIS